jgi:hypothetical protein
VVTGAAGTVPPCPLSFSKEELLQLREDFEGWNDIRKSLFKLTKVLGSAKAPSELKKPSVDEDLIEERNERRNALSF